MSGPEQTMPGYTEPPRDMINTVTAAIQADMPLHGLTNENAGHKSEQWCRQGAQERCSRCNREYETVVVADYGYCLSCAAEVIIDLDAGVREYEEALVGPDDYWSEDPTYPVGEWMYEVQNGDTRRGYWEWVEASRAANADDDGADQQDVALNGQ